MTEMLFDVLWPDDSLDRCYSPSTVIAKHLQVGATYPVEELLEHARSGLLEASERMRNKFGHYCSGACDQLAILEARSTRFEPRQVARVLGLYRRGGAQSVDAVLAAERRRRAQQRATESAVTAEAHGSPPPG